MRFTFVVTGWPGSVHDMRVFNDVVNKYSDKLPHSPPGTFLYLCDHANHFNELTTYLWCNMLMCREILSSWLGVPKPPVYLAPYKGTKYHLLKYQNDPLPKGIKETFNYAHSSLWNAIERSFGVLKMKWRILLDLPSFPMSKQSKIITACMALHNFIREMAVSNEDFYMYVRVENIFQWPRHLPLNHVLAISI